VVSIFINRDVIVHANNGWKGIGIEGMGYVKGKRK
jgi:hypothetical protein